MNTLVRILFVGNIKGSIWRRYVTDTLFPFAAALAITFFIYFNKLYPGIPNISFLYLLVVIGFASTRGLYSAIIASVTAFLSFDYFLVEPFFTFAINRLEEWLALFIFLVTAIITGQLASALRLRAQEAVLRERETRALYDLVNAAASERQLERQLTVVARAILTNFSSLGISDCAILLPDAHGNLQLLADACYPLDKIHLSPDEMATAATVLQEGKIVDLHDDISATPVISKDLNRYIRVMNTKQAQADYVRMIPLQIGAKNVGVMRLLMKGGVQRLPMERGVGSDNPYQPANFFWTFVDQATSMIDRARLQREAIQIELLRRTDALRSALLSSVSHDLRTPLSSIKASASSLLQEDVQWDEETRRSFAVTIERQADRLNRLVGNLLDMSRIEGGALKPEKEWYPIDELDSGRFESYAECSSRT